MLDFKPDIEKTMERMEAFWQRAEMDRPLVQFSLYKPFEEQVPLPASNHATSDEFWLDAQYQAELSYAMLYNREFMAETLPVAFPNLGPEVLASFYGCPLHFGDYGTSWSDPILHDWSDAGQIKLDWQSPYLKKLLEITDAMLEIGKGKFITGMPDWHPGGDLLAALRDPQNLAVDMVEHKEKVQKLNDRLQPDYFKVYDLFYDKFRQAGLPITSWLELASDHKYYIPSNDFSALISKKMFDEVFLPGIINECRFLDRSIYHLDGPGALHHLDSLLSIPELHAFQWVPGAGREGFSRWVKVYQRMQVGGKGIIAYCQVEDLDLVMQTLNPRGLALSISGVEDRQMGKEILRALEKWTAGKI